MTFRFRVTVTLLDGDTDEAVVRAARRLLFLVAVELLRASAQWDDVHAAPEEPGA